MQSFEDTVNRHVFHTLGSRQCTEREDIANLRTSGVDAKLGEKAATRVRKAVEAK